VQTPPSAAAAPEPAESGIQVLDRVVGLLGLLGEANEGGAQLSRLAAGLGLSVSTTHRLLAALEHHGWVERVEGGRRYRLGTALIGLSGQAAEGTGLRRLCRPALTRLTAETGETTFLIVRSGLNAVVVDRQEGTYVIESLTHGVGGLIPLGVGAGSAAILAGQPHGGYRGSAGRECRPLPTVRHHRGAQVRRRVQQIQANGYLLSEDSLISGLAVLSVAIRPAGHNVTAAIAMNFIASRLDTGGTACLPRPDPPGSPAYRGRPGAASQPVPPFKHRSSRECLALPRCPSPAAGCWPRRRPCWR
jgi:DNA-binding IclR family transcriptional regulator